MAVDQGVGYLPWRTASFVFAQVKPFFGSKTYNESIFRGLITCSGGLTESTLKASQKALYQFLSEQKDDLSAKSEFLQVFIRIFQANIKDDLVTIPLMKTIEMLLASDYLSNNDLAKDLIEIHTLCVATCNKSKIITKLLAAIGVFSNMMMYQDQTLVTKALRSILFLLYNVYPKVRQMAAEKLFTSLQMLEDYSMLIPDGDEEKFEMANEMLSETDWAKPLKQLQTDTKDVFYSYFGQVPKPSTVGVKKEESKGAETQIKT